MQIEKIAGNARILIKSRILRKNRAVFEPFQERTQKASCKNEKISEPLPHQAAPAERSWRGVLRGHVPSKSLSADSEIPCAMLLAHGEGG